MTIYTDGAVIRRGQTLEEFQTPLGDYLGAKFDQALDANPLNLATDNRALSQAQDNVVGDYADPLTGFALGELKVTPKPRITADEVRARSEEAGVKVDVPEGGLTSDALDILIARRKRQQVQNDAINRSETGGRSFAGFGVQLGASLLDPLNIGLAFVPVVGQARYAGMIAKAGGAAGRAGVRVGVGAAEGAAGVAAFEPFAFAMHKSLQDDYSALDSLINIGFGSALGGGLHVVGGATKDAFLGQWWKPSITPAPLPELPGTIYGGGTRIKIGENYETARWAVVDAGEVEATMTKAENQFRDRTRVASDEQIRDIANKIDFELLGDSPVMDFGAPTLTADGRIVGGNGRMAAIGRAYDIGTGMRYSDALKRELAKYGIDPAALENMKKPALVRVLDNEVDVKRAAILSNEGGALRMSALEQSKVDAERLGDFRAFDVNDNGEINTAGNRAFIRAWVNQQPVNQRSALMDADGMLSVEGQARLRNAILFKAYGDSPTLGRLVEATDPGSRNVASALTRSAGRVADAQESIKSGDLYDVDIAPDLRAAVEKLDQLRKANSSVAEFLAQGDMLGSGLTPDAIKVMQFMEQNIRSPRAISDMLNRYYDGLLDAGNPKQGDIFGGGAPSKTALLDRAIDAENADPSAASVVEKATPQQREAAMRTAVGQAVDGRVVDVEPIFSREADVASSLQRQSSPEAVRVADVPAARAADERLSTAPKSEALADAEAELGRVMKDLEERAGVVADDAAPARVENPDIVAKNDFMTVYRTERSDPAYKGKAVFGDGLYLGKNEALVGEMQLNPNRSTSQEWTPEMGGVDSYIIPPGTKLKTIDIENMPTAEFNKNFGTDGEMVGNKLRDRVLAEGYDGVEILTGDDLNFGGDQVVIYNKNVKLIDRAVSDETISMREQSTSAKNPLLRELQVYDDAIKSSEELGRAARAAAICDLRA